jgi:hypothetical protein
MMQLQETFRNSTLRGGVRKADGVKGPSSLEWIRQDRKRLADQTLAQDIQTSAIAEPNGAVGAG